MSATFIKTPPPGDLAYISALKLGWHDQFQSLLRQKRSITYDFYPLTKFPEEVLAQAASQGYQHLVLETDQWQHFFISPDHLRPSEAR